MTLSPSLYPTFSPTNKTSDSVSIILISIGSISLILIILFLIKKGVYKLCSWCCAIICTVLLIGITLLTIGILIYTGDIPLPDQVRSSMEQYIKNQIKDHLTF